MSAMQKQPWTELVHSLSGRVRLRSRVIVGHHEACQRIAEKLAMIEPMAEVVEVRPWTGSVIIVREEGELDAASLAALLERLIADERDTEGRKLTELGPERHPGPTKVARALAHAFAEINGDVRGGLDHRADLGTLLPVLFFALGLVEIAATRKLPAPAWFNLLWWSLRSFMTFNQGAVAQEVRENGAREGIG